MKLYTEEQVFNAAGSAFLDPDEVREVAAQVARQCTGTVVNCLLSGNFSDLRARLKQYEKDAREKKAVDAWMEATRAVYDPHRKKWIVLEDFYGDDLEALKEDCQAKIARAEGGTP
jgi:hypothetical protein